MSDITDRRKSPVLRWMVIFITLFFFLSQGSMALASDPTYSFWPYIDGGTTNLDYNPYTYRFGTVGDRPLGDFYQWIKINGEKQVSWNYHISIPLTNAVRSLYFHSKMRPGVNRVTVYDSCYESHPDGPSRTRTVNYNPPAGYVYKEKNLGSGTFCGTRDTVNTINPATGNVFLVETDYKSPGPFPLVFRRYYNSVNQWAGGSAMWDHWNRWRTTYDRSVRVIVADEVVHAKRPDGKLFIFNKGVDGLWHPMADVGERLLETMEGFKYVDKCGAYELYDAEGTLVSLHSNGLTQTLTYDTDGRLTTVTDNLGRTLTLAYDPTTGFLTTITGPGNTVCSYYYDADDNLVQVNQPDGKIREFAYESAVNSKLLTSITHNSELTHTYAYDAESRVTYCAWSDANELTLTYNGNDSTTITDALGESITVYYALLYGMWKLLGMDTGCVTCPTRESDVTYDANGNLASYTDYNGNVTTFVYNDRGLQTSRTEAVSTPQERTITKEWHPDFAKPTLITEPGRTTAYTYNSEGMPLSKTITDTATSATRTWTYTYNGANLLTTVDGPRTDVNDVTTYNYDVQGRCTSQINALGHTTQYGDFNYHGKPRIITDVNGVVNTLTYDGWGKILTSTINGRTCSYTYDYRGNLTRFTRPSGGYVDYAFDRSNRMIQTTDSQSNKISYNRDAKGNVTLRQILDPLDTVKKRSPSTYNPLGMLESQSTADGYATYYTHDGNGNVLTTTDPYDNISSYAYDPLNRLTTVTDDLGGTSSRVYDLRGNLTSITDPNGVQTTYVYNGFDNLLQRSSPDTGTVTMTYNSAGQMLTRTDANGVTATYTLDALGRVTTITFPDPADNITYTYDQGVNGIGRLTGMTDPSGSYTYTYDDYGNLISEIKTILGIGYTTSYAYDQDNLLTSITYPSGRIVSYTRNALGQVTAVTTNGQTVVDTVSWLPFGPPQAMTWGNNIPLSMTYDLNYWLTGLSATNTLDLILGHDLLGHITAITDGLDQGNNETLTYDDLYRLVQAVGAYGTHAFTYDANGNRLTKRVDGQTDTYNYQPGTNRLASVTGANPETFTYDQAGAILSRLAQTYTQDQSGRMVEAVVGGQNTGYLINGVGERVVKNRAAEAVVFHFDQNGQLIAESDQYGSMLKEYIYLGGNPVGVADETGTLHYIHAGYRGEPKAVTNAAGTVIWRAVYEPFGKATVDEDPDGDSQSFTLNVRLPGQYYDSETGLHYNYKRTYAPDIGRFLATDSLGFDGGDLNLYAYCWNNPISWVDPTGQRSEFSLDYNSLITGITLVVVTTLITAPLPLYVTLMMFMATFWLAAVISAQEVTAPNPGITVDGAVVTSTGLAIPPHRQREAPPGGGNETCDQRGPTNTNQTADSSDAPINPDFPVPGETDGRNYDPSNPPSSTDPRPTNTNVDPRAINDSRTPSRRWNYAIPRGRGPNQSKRTPSRTPSGANEEDRPVVWQW